MVRFVQHEQGAPLARPPAAPAQRFVRFNACFHAGSPQRLTPHRAQRSRHDDQRRSHDPRHRDRHERLAESCRVGQHGASALA
jgi:hypothetical protein